MSGPLGGMQGLREDGVKGMVAGIRQASTQRANSRIMLDVYMRALSATKRGRQATKRGRQ
jgi:hypothetical protein